MPDGPLAKGGDALADPPRPYSSGSRRAQVYERSALLLDDAETTAELRKFKLRLLAGLAAMISDEIDDGSRVLLHLFLKFFEGTHDAIGPHRCPGGRTRRRNSSRRREHPLADLDKTGDPGSS